MIETVFGEISSDFKSERLSDLCDRENGIQTGPFGSQLHQKDYVTDGTPIITVEHLGENRIIHDVDLPCVNESDRERLSKFALHPGDIVFSRVGSVDRRALVREEEDGWLFSGRCLRVRPDPNLIDSGYLSYFFGLPAFKKYINAIAVGATMPSLNTQILSNIPIYFPGLAEQRAIAGILGAFDDKIELNRRMNQTLEAIIATIFKSWFIDFDPVRIKAEKIECKLPTHILDLFPNSFEVSDLGNVPSGWDTCSFLNLAELLSGGTPKTSASEYWNGGIPWVSAKDVSNAKGSFILETEKTISDLGLNNSSTKILPPLTTIITARGTVGSYCLLGRAMAMNQTNYGLKVTTYPVSKETGW